MLLWPCARSGCRDSSFEKLPDSIFWIFSCPGWSGWSGGTKITSNYLWVTPMYPMFNILALRDWNLKGFENPKSKAPWKRSRWTARVGTQAVSFSFHVSASACVSSKMKQMASTEYNCAVSPPSPPTLPHTAWSKHCGVATSAFDPPLPTKYVHQKFAVQEYLHKKLFEGKDVPFNDGNVWCASTRTQTKRNGTIHTIYLTLLWLLCCSFQTLVRAHWKRRSTAGQGGLYVIFASVRRGSRHHGVGWGSDHEFNSRANSHPKRCCFLARSFRASDAISARIALRALLILLLLFCFMPRDFLVRFIRLSALRIMQHKRPKSWCSKIHWNESTW